jgi:two-component system, CitB family, sensor histidine kinase DctS
VFEITEEREELIRFLSSRIRHDSLTGLLLGKISRGRELGVDVTIDRHSRLQRFPEGTDHHDFVVLLGNLLENSFDALRSKSGDKRVFVSLEQDDEIASVLVEDNGCGMNETVRERMFERGFTTKDSSSGRGIGMHLITGIAERGGGTIRVESVPGEGTTIIVTFPMNSDAINDRS